MSSSSRAERAGAHAPERVTEERVTGDDRLVEARLEVRGRALGAAFRGFAEDRLRRYGLEGSVSAEATRADIRVRGPAALVDMLEVACLLGPAESLVESCAVVPDPHGTPLA